MTDETTFTWPMPPGIQPTHGLGEVEQLLRHMAALHQHADEDEQRDGDEQEGIHRREHALRQKSIGIEVKSVDDADRGQAERDRERNAERTQQQEEDEKRDAHGCGSLSER